MDNSLKQQKLKMWKSQLQTLEEDLQKILARKGEAISEGDLSENAAYRMANEDADTCRARIEEVKKIIKDLESADAKAMADKKGGK